LEEAISLAKKLKIAGVVETSAKDGLESIDDCFYIALVNAFDRKQQEICLQPKTKKVNKPIN